MLLMLFDLLNKNLYIKLLSQIKDKVGDLLLNRVAKAVTVFSIYNCDRNVFID